MENVINPSRLNNEAQYPGLQDKIMESGYRIENVNGIWITNNAVAVQMIIDAYDPLAYVKKVKKQAIRDDGFVRMQAIYPAITTPDMADLIFDMWRSINANAKSAVADFQRLLDVRSAMKAGITSVTNAASVADVNAVVVVWP